MKPDELMTTGRPVEISYPTNRAIAIVTLAGLVGGMAYTFVTGGVTWTSFVAGLGIGITPFAAWALGREVDPDHDLSAFVAAALSLVSLILLGIPQFVAVFWAMMVLRIVNRTTGLAPGIVDMLALVGLSAWLAVIGNWGFGLIAALALLIAGRLRPRRGLPLWMAGLALVVTLIAAAVAGWPYPIGAVRWPALLIALAIALLFVPVFMASRRLTSVGDQTGEPLMPQRVQAAQALAVLAGLEAVLWQGQPALRWLGPLWAALLGAALWWAGLRVWGAGRRAGR